jgi:hypothetical protein
VSDSPGKLMLYKNPKFVQKKLKYDKAYRQFTKAIGEDTLSDSESKR